VSSAGLRSEAVKKLRPTLSSNRIATLLGALAVVSLAFGVLMFASAERRASKIEETYQKYRAKQKYRAQSWPPASLPAGSRDSRHEGDAPGNPRNPSGARDDF
jgi:hypothetical protein